MRHEPDPQNIGLFVSRYRALNESFNRTLHFHLGVNAGFFSEFNHLVLAALWCLDNRVRLVLYSADANFGVERGWRDFFEPFCPETEDDFHRTHNFRWLKIYQPRRKLRILLEKRRKGLDLLTHDVWRRFKSEAFARRRFEIPELGISGGLLDATRILHRIVWRYEPGTAARVEAEARGFRPAGAYYGVHLRGGDKSTEHEVFAPGRYAEILRGLGGPRRAFVLTDDHLLFEALREELPSWELSTSCGAEERGYVHEEYLKLDQTERTRRLLRLFAAMDVLADSERFVGSFSSNPGMNLGMRMPEGRAIGVDYPRWKIRW